MVSHTNWLLIIDNVEEIGIINTLIPADAKGHIIVTTRTLATGTLAQSIVLEPLSIEEGTIFLLRRAKLLKLDESIKKVPTILRQTASTIVQIMDGHPLAINQAGAYIEETSCSLLDYLNRCQKYEKTLFDFHSEDDRDYLHSLNATLSVSIKKVEQLNAAAADLLKLCCFLHPDAIPEEMIINGNSYLSAALQKAIANPVGFDGMIAILRRYSLIRRDSDKRTLAIHRVVSAVLRNQMSEETQREWIERAMLVVNRTISVVNSSVCYQRYSEHAQTCTNLLKQWNMTIVEAEQLRNPTELYKNLS